jgi:hypothetical protein
VWGFVAGFDGNAIGQDFAYQTRTAFLGTAVIDEGTACRTPSELLLDYLDGGFSLLDLHVKNAGVS